MGRVHSFVSSRQQTLVELYKVLPILLYKFWGAEVYLFCFMNFVWGRYRDGSFSS